MKRALITAVTGQDGAYLTEFPLRKGYEVHGLPHAGAIGLGTTSLGSNGSANLYLDVGIR